MLSFYISYGVRRTRPMREIRQKQKKYEIINSMQEKRQTQETPDRRGRSADSCQRRPRNHGTDPKPPRNQAFKHKSSSVHLRALIRGFHILCRCQINADPIFKLLDSLNRSPKKFPVRSPFALPFPLRRTLYGVCTPIPFFSFLLCCTIL